jgi:hypothetical protein
MDIGWRLYNERRDNRERCHRRCKSGRNARRDAGHNRGGKPRPHCQTNRCLKNFETYYIISVNL